MFINVIELLGKFDLSKGGKKYLNVFSFLLWFILLYLTYHYWYNRIDFVNFKANVIFEYIINGNYLDFICWSLIILFIIKALKAIVIKIHSNTNKIMQGFIKNYVPEHYRPLLLKVIYSSDKLNNEIIERVIDIENLIIEKKQIDKKTCLRIIEYLLILVIIIMITTNYDVIYNIVIHSLSAIICLIFIKYYLVIYKGILAKEQILIIINNIRKTH